MKRSWLIFGGLAVAGAIGLFVVNRNKGGSDEIVYKYAKIEKGDLVRSISATGQLVPLTKVDIRSKAGGKIVSLKVEEGDFVKQGEVIALIDPDDTRAVYEQAQADLTSAQSRAEQARINASLESKNRQTAVQDAEIALRAAQIRLARTEASSKAQPTLTSADLANAQASLKSAQAALDQMTAVDIPRLRQDSRVSADQARVQMDNARTEFERQQRLFEQNFVAKSAVERAQSAFESARASHTNAQERLRTVESEIDAMLRTQRARVEQAKATVAQSDANKSRLTTTQKDVEEARNSVRQAELNLKEARDNLAQIRLRQSDVKSAQASTVRSRVQLDNAKIQLDSTTVTAPRDGVVTTKYIEEGTIIPPGTSTFSQGTAIVQLSDVTTMYVECAVDEADISQVRDGQNVKILVEAFPGRPLKGTVERVFPSAATEQNITAVKVRVKVEANRKVNLRPGMNATCEFLTMEKNAVAILPSQAIVREGKDTFVRIKGKGTQPEKVKVELGEEGNEGVEILSGIKEGQEVVIAEINMAEIRDIQKRMLEAQQGGSGGLAGGQQGRGGSRSMATGGGGAGTGGARGAGGAGGGR